jgi:CBS domain containing-hemolysin-like protein
MFLALAIAALISTPLLVFVTLVQMLYMDSVRVRARDLPFLELFRESISDRIGLKVDNGILTFSLVKHSLLTLMGSAFVGAAFDGTPDMADIAEGAVLGWLAMLTSAYIVPQMLYRRTSGKWFLTFVPVVRVLAFAVRPLTGFLGFLQSLVQLGEKDQSSQEEATPEENIDALISAGAEEGILEEEDRKLIQSVVAFGDKTVREVMTPRPSMVAIDVDATLDDLRQLVIHEQFSRIPVYEGNIDAVIGFVHVRDMFELDHTERTQRTVRELLRPIRLVPETKPVGDLLREMQRDGAHMAVVIDEYGSTAGVVTMEDMVEEIVGEIRDEHEPGHDLEPDKDGGYVVSGSFDLDHLHELFDFRPSDETEATTVGGLVTEWMGRVPEPGDSVERDGLRIEVLAANDLRVDQVRISKAIPAPNHNGTEKD